MSWQVLIGLSVLLYSVNGLMNRAIMKHDESDGYTQSVAFCALVCVITVIISFFYGGLHWFSSWYQVLVFVPSVVLGALGSIYAFKGFKLVGASEHVILSTSTKLWFLVGTFVLLGEAFSLPKVIGGLLIIGGVVIAQWRKGKFVLNTGAWYVLASAFLYALSDLLSFLLVREFDVLSLIAYGTGLAAILMIIARPATIRKLRFYKSPQRLTNIVIVSINDALASVFAFMAYQVGRNALQLGPLGATQTIVTVFLALIFLGETDYMYQKILGALTVVLGMWLLL
jgi:drug/metabolite transporter (DMT)-like permease